jgi:transposase
MSRRKFSSNFKKKVALEALKERETVAELAQKYNIHPQQVNQWRRELESGAEQIFESPKKDKKGTNGTKEDDLMAIIGRQKVEIDFLKKVLS